MRVASTSKGAELTEEHRLEQVRIADLITAWILKIFGQSVDFNDFAGSAAQFAREAAPKVMQYREASAMLSRDYLDAFSILENPDHSSQPPLDVADLYSVEDAVGELMTAARVALKRVQSKGYSGEEAMRAAGRAAAGRAQKIALDGGRHVLESDVRHGRPIGYARVVDSDPCPFCAMLASRGISYTGALEDGAGLYQWSSFAASDARFAGGGRFKVHDHCCCTMEPVYRKNGKIKLPGNGDQLAREWAQVAAGQDDPQAAWRRWRESGTLPDDYQGPLHGTKRPKPPVAGQRDGKRPAPTPTHRPKSDSPWAKPYNEVTKDDYLEYAADQEVRARRLQDEIDSLKSLGKTDNDIAVYSLVSRRKRVLSQIERYRKHAETM